jgi:hypothetical protein
MPQTRPAIASPLVRRVMVGDWLSTFPHVVERLERGIDAPRASRVDSCVRLKGTW